MITAFPEVKTIELMDEDEFLIIACDGIWDMIDNQKAVDFIKERIIQNKKLSDICDEVFNACLAPDVITY